MLNKCLFPAAGYGTRFLPVTKAMPKEMLPISGKPLIQYGVEEAMNAGISEMGIIVGRNKRAIADHFDINYELEHKILGTDAEKRLSGIRQIIDECSFSYTRQNSMLGLGHAILTGKTLVCNEPFGVILADDLCVGKDIGVLAQMMEIYKKHHCCIVALREVDPIDVCNYGIVSGIAINDRLYRIKSLIEKPTVFDAPSNLAIMGRYILTPDIFDALCRTKPDKNGHLQLTDALQIQINDNPVLGYKFKGLRFDCGTLEGFVKATNYFFNKDEAIK